MQALRAYARAGEISNPRYNSYSYNSYNSGRAAASGREKIERKSGGDSLSLSAEALEMLANGGGAGSICPQDATYDQSGHVTRQLDDLQRDLRRLASQVLSTPQSSGMAIGLNALQGQLASIQARV